jgi:hypothetical protein
VSKTLFGRTITHRCLDLSSGEEPRPPSSSRRPSEGSLLARKRADVDLFASKTEIVTAG